MCQTTGGLRYSQYVRNDLLKSNAVGYLFFGTCQDLACNLNSFSIFICYQRFCFEYSDYRMFFYLFYSHHNFGKTTAAQLTGYGLPNIFSMDNSNGMCEQ